MAIAILEIENDLAKQRMVNAHASPVQMNRAELGSARDIVAKKIGVSPTTFQRAITIIKEGDKKLQEKVRTGKTLILKHNSKVLQNLNDFTD